MSAKQTGRPLPKTDNEDLAELSLSEVEQLILQLRRLREDIRDCEDQRELRTVRKWIAWAATIVHLYQGDYVDLRAKAPGFKNAFLAMVTLDLMRKDLTASPPRTEQAGAIANSVYYIAEAELALVHYLEARKKTVGQSEVQWTEKKVRPMTTRNSIVREIEAAWGADTSLTALAQLPQSLLERAAAIAADVASNTKSADADDEFVDNVSGLVLPPKLRTPYRERGHHPNGKRLTIFEHLRREYAGYLDAGLLFSGHLFEIDRPAYEALLYAAEKEAKELHLKKGENTADFALRHGILTNEHLVTPPKGFERQVELLRTLRTSKKAAGMTQAAAKKLDKLGSGR